MEAWAGVVDWVGGWPYEVATPGAVFAFLHERGFILEHLTSTSGLGCNEFVLRKERGELP
jgi:2-polyprenyl-6-hydroxyphenyl methylase/3-demethylubiquinone-9 3-methyltransferase